MSLNTILATTPLTSTGYHLKATGTTIGNSLIWDNGTNVLIGSTTTDFGILGITTSNAVGFTSALGLGFRTNVAEGDSVGISFKTKISLSGTIWENARIAAITESIATSANGALAFYTMNATTLAEKMRITPSGNVGIGTSTPDFPLTVKTDASANSIKILGRSSGDTSVSWNSSDNATQYVHIDIGAAYSQLWSISNFQIFASTNQATGGAYNTFGNLYVASTTAQGTDIGGSISIGGKYNNAGAYATFARIQGKKENGSTGQTGGYLALEVATDVTNLLTERMRILSGGNVIVGSTSGAGRITTWGTGTTSATYSFIAYNSSGFGVLACRDDWAVSFASLGTGTVYSNGGILTNTNPSDLRLKTNIESVQYGLNEILQLNAVTYNLKEDKINQGKQYGFIAQDVQKVMPDLVNPLQFEEDLLGLNKEAIYTILVKAIQEMNTKLDEQNQTIQNLQEQINILAK